MSIKRDRSDGGAEIGSLNGHLSPTPSRGGTEAGYMRRSGSHCKRNGITSDARDSDKKRTTLCPGWHGDGDILARPTTYLRHSSIETDHASTLGGAEIGPLNYDRRSNCSG